MALRSLTFAVMIGLSAGLAGAQTVQPPTPPPFPTGAPPGPEAGEIKLLNVEGRAPVLPDIVAPALPGGTRGAPALGAPVAPVMRSEKAGVALNVTTKYTKNFDKYDVVATVETTDRGTIDQVTYTGPGRFGTSSTNAGTAYRITLQTADAFTLRARVRRPSAGGEKPSAAVDLSVDVAPPAATMLALREDISATAVATLMRSGGYQYELKLTGALDKDPKVLAVEWLLPAGFKEPTQRSSDASTGFAVTGDFDREFSAAGRVLFSDGTIGLTIVKAEPK